MSTKKKVAAVLITTVALSAGTVGVASADSKSKNNRVVAHGVKGIRGDMTAFLAELVAKGTITQAQADAITAAAKAAKSAADAMRPTKPDRAEQLALIASTIGIDTATVQSRLKAGESLATIAGAKKDALIAALVADHTKRIDADVASGKITAAQATKMKAKLTEHVTEVVNSTRNKGEKNGHKGGHRDGDKSSSTTTTAAAA
jgi:polyhydroxyalkanoate synthesis regulator phasin